MAFPSKHLEYNNIYFPAQNLGFYNFLMNFNWVNKFFDLH